MKILICSDTDEVLRTMDSKDREDIPTDKEAMKYPSHVTVNTILDSVDFRRELLIAMKRLKGES